MELGHLRYRATSVASVNTRQAKQLAAKEAKEDSEE
jgi:hypothetical protein